MFRSIAASLCSIGNDHPFVPTCLLAERRAQRQSRMPPQRRRHQDDPLGSGLTDASGHFRIDYSGADFRKGTFINVELFGGPDVYFRVETVGRDVVLAEPPSEGRAPGRENIGPCFCVGLCIDQPPVVRHAWFTRVGDFNIYSDMDAGTGLTVSAQPFGFPGAHGGPGFGFWSSMKLVGDCPTTHPSGGQPMRYRFTTRPTGR